MAYCSISSVEMEQEITKEEKKLPKRLANHKLHFNDLHDQPI